jgi:hypothetical protein
MGISSIERRLKELKDVELIDTYHPHAGGKNHYQFYDHPWMHQSIIKELAYKSDPPSEVTVPPVRSDGTPPSKVTDINKKKVKEIKKAGETPATATAVDKLTKPHKPHKPNKFDIE